MLQLVTHPLVHDCLAELRDSRTSPERFRALANRISVLLGAEALRDVPTVNATVETPLGPSPCRRLAADVVMAPVLRPASASAGDAGARSKCAFDISACSVMSTAVVSQYYAKLPKHIEDSYVLLIDPMLATGGSAVAALDMLTKAGARHLRLVCIVAAPEGVAAVEHAYPSVPIFTPVVDRELNAHKFIVPGLGDFGDRLFGTI